MKNKIKEIAQKAIVDLQEKQITRKQAIKKTALIAVSAATMMMLLSKNAGAAGSLRPGGIDDSGWN